MGRVWRTLGGAFAGIGVVLAVLIAVVVGVYAAERPWAFGDPSPESEVRRLLVGLNPGSDVEVDQCANSTDGSHSDWYVCAVVATERLTIGQGEHITPGTTRYCFAVPRTRGIDNDFDAYVVSKGRC